MIEMNATRLLKILGAWAVVILVYVLLYNGVTEGLWPMIAHFRHMDWRVPEILDGIIGSAFAPFIAGFLICGTLRRELSSPWPVCIAPLLLILLLGYTSNSFYPPWWREALVRLAGGALQGVFAWVGWFLYKRWSHHSRTNPDNDDLDARPSKTYPPAVVWRANRRRSR